MATGNPLHPTTDDRFNQNQYNQKQWGATNAQVVREERQSKRPIPAAGRRSRFAPQDQVPLINEPVTPDSNRNQSVKSVRPARKKTGKVELGLKVAARTTSPVVSAFLYILIGFFTPVQLVLGVLAGLALFIGAGLYSISDEASLITEVLAYAGMTPENFIFIFLGVSGLILFLNFIQIVVGSVLFKIGLARPLGGRGGSLKITAIIVIIVTSFMPLLQIIPLVWLWVVAVTLNPR